MHDTSSVPLDILISSGQPWANAASVLGRPGDAGDILWIETPLARKKGWTRGASDLLRAQGFTVLPPLEITEDEERDLGMVQRRVRETLATHDGRVWHLHLNGGTKLLSSTIQEVVGNRADLHYSEPGRHHLRSFGGWSSFEPGLRVRLEDLLLCYGQETDRAGWATDRPRPESQGPSYTSRRNAFFEHQRELASRQGNVLEESALHSRWSAYDRTLAETLLQQPESSPLELVQWLGTSEGLAWFSAYRLRLRPHLLPIQVNAQLRHFCETLRWEAGWQNAQAPHPTRSSGPTEGSVGALYETRVERALNPLRSQFGVIDQGSNIRVMTPNAEALLVEMDHVWLLSTGRVVVFEAKSGMWNVKDMRSRMQNYRDCFGSETKAILVQPPFRGDDAKSVSEARQSKDNAEVLGLGYLQIPATEDLPDGLDGLEAQLKRII